jgi:hypothetical protein
MGIQLKLSTFERKKIRKSNRGGTLDALWKYLDETSHFIKCK